MNQQTFIELIAKKLSGSISEEERKSLEAYISENVEGKKIFDEISKQWELSGKFRLDYKSDPENSWNHFLELRDQRGEGKTVSLFSILSKLAAIVIITLGLGFLLHEFGKSEPTYYATFEGETKTVILADSSKIHMNESSLLTVSADFNIDDRKMSIKGEAFFEIFRDEEKPFIIESGDVTTAILGTSFNIRAREEEPEIHLSVASGKVSFFTAEKELILTKGMTATYNINSEKLEKKSNSSYGLAWHTKSLLFEDSSMESVVKDLNAFFDVTIMLEDDKLNACHFSGQFKNPELEDILKAICDKLQLTYTKKEDSYLLQGAGWCKN